MPKFVIGLAALLVLAGIAAGVFYVRRLPAPEPPAVAIERVPIAPLPAPVAAAAAAAPKRPDLPTIEVEAHDVHEVPDGEPPAAKPVTLRTRDGRLIDPASGRAR
jgi:hypothetical protein